IESSLKDISLLPVRLGSFVHSQGTLPQHPLECPQERAARDASLAAEGARFILKVFAFALLRAMGLHPDDPRMDALFQKCAGLKMPVNIHVADPIWMYEKMDNTNDGLMNAYRWRLDNQPAIVGHSGMIDFLERTVKKHPQTIFIACHFANLD